MRWRHTLALPLHPPTLTVRDPSHCFAEDVNTIQSLSDVTHEFTLRQDSHLRIVQVLLAIVFLDVVRHRSEATQSMIESLDELVSREPTRISQSQLYTASQHHPLELLITTIFAILTAVSQYRVTPHGPHLTRQAQ
jgi:acid phosphatase family membrane protein YuiD